MRVPFVKMHGLGNDFIVLDARHRTLPPLGAAVVRRLADRQEGIGCDQLIVLEPSDEADLTMRIFNCDGQEVEACGNGARAVAMFVGEPTRAATSGGTIRLEPGAGGASVDMGEPRFDWRAIPLAYAMDTNPMPVGWDALERPTAVNVGNPHAVFIVDDADAIDLGTVGPEIERDPLFAQGVNVNVAAIRDRAIDLRVWERGAGLTRACGTGACATAVTAIRRGLVASPVEVRLPGGSLTIAWAEGGSIRMTGPATTAFTGSVEWDDYA